MSASVAWLVGKNIYFIYSYLSVGLSQGATLCSGCSIQLFSISVKNSFYSGEKSEEPRGKKEMSEKRNGGGKL